MSTVGHRGLISSQKAQTGWRDQLASATGKWTQQCRLWITLGQYNGHTAVMIGDDLENTVITGKLSVRYSEWQRERMLNVLAEMHRQW